MSQPQAELPDGVDWKAFAERERRWERRIMVAALCLVVFGVPAWWLWGTVQRARELNHRTSCNCRLKQIGLALVGYNIDYHSFPPAFVLGPDGQKWHSWRVLVLPYLDQRALYNEYRFDEPWDGPNNRKLIDKMPEIFACPSRPCPVQPAALLSIGILACSGGGPSAASGFTSYAVVLGQDCAFPGSRPASFDDFADGTSNTILLGECTRTKIPWTKPEDIDVAFFSKLGDPEGFGSPHAGGANFLMGDGTVKFISTSLPQATLDALFTRNGGETIRDF